MLILGLHLPSPSSNGSENGKCVRQRGSMEWKERTSKWWKRERSRTVALTNVFPGCSHSNQIPRPLMLSLTDHCEEKKKKEAKRSHHQLQHEATISSWGNKQWACTRSHSVSISEILRGCLFSEPWNWQNPGRIHSLILLISDNCAFMSHVVINLTCKTKKIMTLEIIPGGEHYSILTKIK